MYGRFSHRDDSAWAKGDVAYELGDTLETGAMKAAQEGIRPCSDGYAAFMTAFGRRVRTREVSPHKRPKTVGELKQVAPPANDQEVWRAA
jgi:hypothetical protein